MKNWRRALSLVLCLLMVAALLPTITTKAANTPPEISITGLDNPVVGEAPDTTATINAETYRIKAVVWQQYMKNGRFGYTWQAMKDDAKFAANGIYRCVFVVELAGGFPVPENITGLSATINGKTAVVDVGSSGRQISVCMNYYFSAEGKLLGNYILSFNANGGSGNMKRIYMFADEIYMLPMCTFTPPEGKSFRTWSVDGEGLEPGEELGPGYVVWAESDITVTALWKDHTCTPKGVARVEPTCVAEGKEAYYKCDLCGRTYEDANGTKLISDVAAWGILAKVDTHTDGNSDGTCDACGYKAHVCTLEGIARVEPTCVAEGKKAYYRCYGCGKVYEDENMTKVIKNVDAWGILAKVDHTASDWSLDGKNHWKRCTVAGCGATIEGSREAHADGDGDGKCDACGYQTNKTVQSGGSLESGEPTATTGDSSGEDSSTPVITEPAEGAEGNEGNNSLWWLWVLIVVLIAMLVAGGITTVFIIIKKKKQA